MFIPSQAACQNRPTSSASACSVMPTATARQDALLAKLEQQPQEIIDACLAPLSHLDIAYFAADVHQALPFGQANRVAPHIQGSLQRTCRSRYLTGNAGVLPAATIALLGTGPVMADIEPPLWPRLLHRQERMRVIANEREDTMVQNHELSAIDAENGGNGAFTAATDRIKHVGFAYPRGHRVAAYGHASEVTPMMLWTQRTQNKQHGAQALQLLHLAHGSLTDSYVGRFVAATALAMTGQARPALALFELGWATYLASVASVGHQRPNTLPTVAQPYRRISACLPLIKDVALATGSLCLYEFATKTAAASGDARLNTSMTPTPNEIMHTMLGGHATLLGHLLQHPSVPTMDLSWAIENSMKQVNRMAYGQAESFDPDVHALIQNVHRCVLMAFRRSKDAVIA